MKQISYLILLLLSVHFCYGQDRHGQRIDMTIVAHQYCPDAVKAFPPINIKTWKKTPVVNGRLPTWEETENGTSITYINKKLNPDLKDVKAYKTTLPRLAYITNPETKKREVVVVIQMVQFPRFVYVGYRFLTGGVGSCRSDQCRFLTGEEVKKATR